MAVIVSDMLIIARYHAYNHHALRSLLAEGVQLGLVQQDDPLTAADERC